MGSQHETVFLSCSAFDAGQELRGHLDHSATALADEVGVDVVGEVIDGAAVAEMGVLDHAEPFEHVHRPVDGREMGTRHGVVNPLHELVRGEVAVGTDELFDDRPPGGCDPLALAAEVREDSLDAIRHRRKATASAGHPEPSVGANSSHVD